ncbi:ABC1-domain-containing protein [Rozella allomycis CSF55]|uniref:ABC1-domain-containing protein n=1 Tax=Rozella allomycis (strain CSF55) TaxID=988480 RepID=A0A4V1IZG8_ROZAC|nr:ABC1-domain-containing protein [Rozella allomycis CSF55]
MSIRHLHRRLIPLIVGFGVAVATQRHGPYYSVFSNTASTFFLRPLRLQCETDETQLIHYTLKVDDLLPQKRIPRLMFYVSCMIRFFQLGIYFIPALLTFPVAYLTQETVFKSSMKNWYKLLRWTLRKSGPTFIKLGQWASTRPDIFPETFCVILSKLHDDAYKHAYQDTIDIFRVELNSAPNEIFDTLDPEPVGSGCIAQVYRGVLKKNRKIVAVKVRHPNVENIIKKDLALMYFIFRSIDSIPSMEWIGFSRQWMEFGTMMLKQLDFRLEAKNLQKFGSNFRSDHHVVFPSPILELTTEGILIESFEEAFPVQDIIKLSDNRFNGLKSQVAFLGLHSFLKMMLLDNFTHADLHPVSYLNNFWLKTPFPVFVPFEESIESVDFIDDNRPIDDLPLHINSLQDPILKEFPNVYDPQLIFVDTGLTIQLAKPQMRDFLDLFEALVLQKDGYKVGKLIVERSPQKAPALNPVQFCSKMGEMITGLLQESGLNFVKHDFGEILLSVFRMVRDHHVVLDERFTNLGMSLVILEGLGRQLSPSTDLFEAAKPALLLALRKWINLKHECK